MLIKVYTYKDPFIKKDFDSIDNWITNKDIEIDDDVSNFILDVLYPKQMKE